MSDMMTVQDYVQSIFDKNRESDPVIVELYKEQLEIERLRSELESREKAFDEHLRAVGPYADAHYRVTDMRETRMLDMGLIKKNFRDIWEQSTPSDKYLIEQLRAFMGNDKLCNMVKSIDEAEYDRQRTMTLAEFDKAAGDSSAKKKYVGTAYHPKFTPTKKTKIECLDVPVMKQFPSKYGQAELTDGDDE